MKGVVAGGSTFVLNPPNGSKSYTWIANIVAGTEVFFFMTDSTNRQGGTSDLMTVQQSQFTSCLDSSSPASATNPPSFTGGISATTSTTTSMSTQTSGTHGSTSTSHSKTSKLIVAIVVPVIAVITVMIIGVMIWYRRRRNGGVRVLGSRFFQAGVDLMKGDTDTRNMEEVGSPTSAVPFLHGRSPSADGTTTHGSYSPRLPTSATTSQFAEFLPAPGSVYSDSTQGCQYGAMSATVSSHGGCSQYGSASGPPVAYASGPDSVMHLDGDTAARRKAAEAGVLTPSGHQPSAQFILHTDIEDSVPPPVSEVIELPPQYSERHAAAPAASGSVVQPHGDLSSPQP